MLAAPLLTKLYLADDSLVDVGLANSLAYLLLPQIFFYGIAALFGAILNTKEKFGVPAWAPVANNLVVIGVGIAFFFMSGAANGTGAALSQLTRGQLLFLGIGTTAGIVLQALVMVPALLRSGFRFRWRWGGDRRLLEAGQPDALGGRLRPGVAGRVHRRHQHRVGQRGRRHHPLRLRLACCSSCPTGSSASRS